MKSTAKPNGKNGYKKNIRKIFEFKLKLTPKNIILWIIAIIVFTMILSNARDVSKLFPNKPLSTLLQDAKSGEVKKVEVIDTKLLATYKDDKIYSINKESQDSFYKTLTDSGVDPKTIEIDIKDTTGGAIWTNLISNVLPLVLMVGFFLFLIRQARGAQDNLFSFGQSRARLFAKDTPKVTFASVAGVDEAKQELSEVVDFLKNPHKYQALGARTPKGVLLVGPSGTGKTLLARALAGEAKVPFFSMAGSEFMEMLVGVGASVTGNTPILIKKDGQVKLLPIAEFIDKYYQESQEGKIIPVVNVETLGFKKKVTKFWGTQKNAAKSVFDKSCWQKVFGVYRHKVKEIYTVYYLDGEIETTGDHSVFVRKHGWIEPKKVSELIEGDILVSLPMNVRRWDYRQRRTIHELKTHEFNQDTLPKYLPVWDTNEELKQKYDYALSMMGSLSQKGIGEEIGVSQATVGNWQNGVHMPQLLSRKLVKLDLPDKVEVTPGLMQLLGLYTAEGRSTNSLEFTFGVHEKEIYTTCIDLVKEIFEVSPSQAYPREDNSFKIVYYCHQLGRFFERYCGNGSHNKHLPSFIWDLPRNYFLSFLKGYSDGDGYVTRTGKLSISSVSCQLITELAWLCSLHGIKAGIKEEEQKAGRIIKDHNKPLPGGKYWTLIIGKTSNPFNLDIERPFQIKRAIVKKIVKRPYDGYVYDLCGVENEAFFGGVKPLLLHNSRVRDLFNTAKKSVAAIIFIDEIDAIGRMRSVGVMGGHDEREQTLNQILVEMDGFTQNENVVVVAATNRGDLLDPALLRPGRFDRRVVLDLPDMTGREAILKIHINGKPMAKDVDWQKVAKRTVGFSGADLENMLNEAAILAARKNKTVVDMEDIEEAATKVKLGPEKKRLQTDLDKKMTAYHEAGHAIVTYKQKHMDPVHRISIVSRGMSLGYTLIPPQKDRIHETKTHLLEEISSMLGGRAAEQLIFKEMTTGAASDIDKASSVARDMVVEFGMSDLGPVNFGPTIDTTEWGGRYFNEVHISQDMQNKIDQEVKMIIDKCYQEAEKILKKSKSKLDLVAVELLKKETLEREDFEKLMLQ